MIGHEGPKNLWWLCGNVDVLVASQNVRIASPSQALAQSVLNGDPIIPTNIVNDGGQQSFLDARRVAVASEDDIVPSPVLDDALPIRNQDLPPIPEEEREEPLPAEEGVWGVRPGIFDGDDSNGDDGGDDETLPDAIPSRRRTATVVASDRNVRPRTEVRQTEQRGTSLMPSRKESPVSEAASASASASAPSPSACAPRSWPSIHRNLDDLSQQLREQFARARAVQDQGETRAMFTTFLS